MIDQRARTSSSIAVAAMLAAMALPCVAAVAPASDTVLVKLDRDATRSQRADVTDALDAHASRGLPGGWRAYRVPDGMTLDEARGRLATTDADRAVELDGWLHPALTPNDTLFGSLHALPLIQATTAWDTPHVNATPVTVAVIDTGVEIAHPDLAPMIWTNPGEVVNGADDDGNGLVDDISGWDFLNNNASVYDGPDDDHGTHVAGTIGAVRGNAAGVAGVADNVRIMPLKFLGPTGGPTSAAISAISYARQKGARVINASWGGGTPSQALCDAVQAAAAAGVLFVAAAGNDGDNNDTVVNEPANCPSPGLISVAATTAGDGLASFSNFGPATVDLGAPGVDILSTLPVGGYGYADGTSMAAPHVSGAAALLLGQDPGLTPTSLRTMLMSGGAALPALATKTVSGRRLSAAGALALAISPGSDTTPPGPFGLGGPTDGSGAGARPDFSWTESVDIGTGIARYRLLVDGAVSAETGAEVLSARPAADLTEGAHTWAVEAEDRAGLRRATPTRTVVVDTGPPQPFVLGAPQPAATVGRRQPTFTWGAAVDAGAGLMGYRLAVDGLSGTTLSRDSLQATASAPLADGPHTWQVQAVDLLGRERSTEQRTFVVDATPPSALGARTPVDAVRLRARRPSFAWSPSRDAAGAVTYEVVLNGKTVTSGLRRTSWRPRLSLRRGRHIWRARAVDAAGNARLSPTETFSIVRPSRARR